MIYIIIPGVLLFIIIFTFGIRKKQRLITAAAFFGFIAAISFANMNRQQFLQASEEQQALRVNSSSEYNLVKLERTVLIEDIPAISQFPELERGCEVTSLAMLLAHAGISVDKLELAEEIKKNPAEYVEENGKIYYGDPNEGFVGDIYTKNQPGLGVYHKPIAELAAKYLTMHTVLDLTGHSFEDLKIHLSSGKPVWVIISFGFKKLPESRFETWVTPNGEIQITYQEHSVLLTGYDDLYVYFNDPYDGKKKKARADDFIESWQQMGSQAITYLEGS